MHGFAHHEDPLGILLEGGAHHDHIRPGITKCSGAIHITDPPAYDDGEIDRCTHGTHHFRMHGPVGSTSRIQIDGPQAQ